MAKETKDIWNDNDGDENKKPEKTGGFRRFIRFLLILVAVLAVVVVAAYRDGTGFDALRRFLNYGDVQSAGGVVYDYDASPANRYAGVGEHLAVLSDTRLSLLTETGEESWFANVSMEAPALVKGGDRVAAYDVGGTELYVVGQEGELLHLTTGEEEPFIAANLNDQGWLTVIAEKQGWKGWVSVYDPELELVFVFKSSDRFVTDACVTDDGKHLAAVTLGQEEGVFVSNVVLYDLNATDPEAASDAEGGLTAKGPVADYDISDGLVIAVSSQLGQVITVSDTCLTIAGTDGNVTASYGYRDHYLRGYTLDGDGFTALLLNRYRSGSVGRLVTVGPDGAELASLEVNQEVLDISAAGRYLAVLYADSLVIYNQDLQVYASLKGTDFAGGVRVRPDGTALLLSAEYASLFLP